MTTITSASVSASNMFEITKLRLLPETKVPACSAPRINSGEIKRLSELLTPQRRESAAIETASNYWNFQKIPDSQTGYPRTLEITEQLNLHLNRYLIPTWSKIEVQNDWVSDHSAVVIPIKTGNFTRIAEELRSDLDKPLIRIVKDVSVFKSRHYHIFRLLMT